MHKNALEIFPIDGRIADGFGHEPQPDCVGEIATSTYKECPLKNKVYHISNLQWYLSIA